MLDSVLASLSNENSQETDLDSYRRTTANVFSDVSSTFATISRDTVKRNGLVKSSRENVCVSKSRVPPRVSVNILHRDTTDDAHGQHFTIGNFVSMQKFVRNANLNKVFLFFFFILPHLATIWSRIPALFANSAITAQRTGCISTYFRSHVLWLSVPTTPKPPKLINLTNNRQLTTGEITRLAIRLSQKRNGTRENMHTFHVVKIQYLY